MNRTLDVVRTNGARESQVNRLFEIGYSGSRTTLFDQIELEFEADHPHADAITWLEAGKRFRIDLGPAVVEFSWEDDGSNIQYQIIEQPED